MPQARSFSLARPLLRSTAAWWLVACVLVLARVWLPSAWIEAYYSRGVFPVVRQTLDAAFGWWPVPASVVSLGLAVSWIAGDAWRQSKRAGQARQKIGRIALSLARSGAVLGAYFLLAWGLNYGRVPLDRQLGLETRRLSTEELWVEIEETARAAEIIRGQLPRVDPDDPLSRPLAQAGVARIRAAVERQLRALGYPHDGRVRMRTLPPGALLALKTSGIYWPLTGEGHVDGGLHALQVPYVTAHELTHGYGFGDEGACNFVAWLALTRADNLFLRYAGHLMYYRYLGSALRRRDPEGYAAFRQNLSPAVVADLDGINRNLDRYREFAPRVRDVVYDNYLRSQGVADGMASYSRVIDLVAAWQSERRAPRALPTAGRR